MKLRISVAGIACRDGSVLVMRRLPGGSIGGLWEFPGGKVKEGEQPQESLRREWMEETGLVIQVGQEIARGRFSHKGQAFTLIAFSIDLPSHESIPSLREHDAYRWMKPEELPGLSLPHSDRIIAEIVYQESVKVARNPNRSSCF